MPGTLNTFLLSALLGGGLYGGGRLIRDIGNNLQKPTTPADELQLTLPKARLPQTMSKMGSLMENAAPIMAGAVGMPLGFLGASSIYELIKKRQMDAEQQRVQQNYLSQLGKNQQKFAEETPLTDEFCAGMMDKNAEGLFSDVLDPVGALGRGLGGAIGAVGSGAVDKGKELGSKILNSGPAKDLGTLLLLSTLGFGGATYALGRRSDLNHREQQRNMVLPSTVKINTI